MDHESYYKTLPDYTEISSFIDRDPNNYEPPVDIEPFKPGYSFFLLLFLSFLFSFILFLFYSL